MSAESAPPGMRAVLEAPRGRRFARPGHSAAPTREQRLLAQMRENPRVAYRQAHGVLPAWMEIQDARLAERDLQAPESPRDPSPLPRRPPEPVAPRPRPAPDGGPLPLPRPQRPPLPRRSRRPHSHRKPRRPGCVGWHLTGYTLAALAGALAHHLTTGLF